MLYVLNADCRIGVCGHNATDWEYVRCVWTESFAHHPYDSLHHPIRYQFHNFICNFFVLLVSCTLILWFKSWLKLYLVTSLELVHETPSSLIHIFLFMVYINIFTHTVHVYAAILAWERTTNFFYAYYVLKTITAMVCEGGVLCISLGYLVILNFSLFLHAYGSPHAFLLLSCLSMLPLRCLLPKKIYEFKRRGNF